MYWLVDVIISYLKYLIYPSTMEKISAECMKVFYTRHGLQEYAYIPRSSKRACFMADKTLRIICDDGLSKEFNPDTSVPLFITPSSIDAIGILIEDICGESTRVDFDKDEPIELQLFENGYGQQALR